MWTVVGRRPGADDPRRLPAPGGWNWHAHHNAADQPMAWIDGLDIPFQYYAESQFFEFGRDAISDAERVTPERSRSERLWGHPGLRPVVPSPMRASATRCSPTAGPTPTSRSPTSSTSRTRVCRARSSPGTPRSASPTRRPAATCCRRSAPRSTACAAAPRPPRARGRLVGLPGVRRLRHRDRRRHSWSVTRGDLFVVPSWQPSVDPLRGRASDSDSGALDLFRSATPRSSSAPPRPHPRGRTHPMKLATLRTARRHHRAVRVEDDRYVDLGALTWARCSPQPDWRDRSAAAAAGPTVDTRLVGLRPRRPPTRQGRLRRLNYRNHILEMGATCRSTPRSSASTPRPSSAPHDDIQRPVETDELDWECELAIVIGPRPARADDRGRRRRRSPASPCSTTSPAATGSSAPRSGSRARTGRPRPRRPVARHPGRAARRSAPDARDPHRGRRRGHAEDNTGDLLFDPVALVEYISTMITLQPGDVIATGTPGGVGHARKPARYLTAGQNGGHRGRGPRPLRERRRGRRAGLMAPRTSRRPSRWMAEGTELFLKALERSATTPSPPQRPARLDRQARRRPRRGQRRRAGQPGALGPDRRGDADVLLAGAAGRRHRGRRAAARAASCGAGWPRRRPAWRSPRRADPGAVGSEVRTAQGRTVPAPRSRGCGRARSWCTPSTSAAR